MVDAARWGDPPSALAISAGEVHVWRACPVATAAHSRLFAGVLSPDERRRAESYRFEQDRARYAATRGLLRLLLGRYLRAEPDALRFSYGPFGKPALTPEADPGGLRFNVSHSGDVALIAVARGRGVGIDVEQDREGLEYVEMAERFLPSDEVAVLRRLSGSALRETFFACWTRREAYAKGLGLGLALAPDRPGASPAREDPPAALPTADDEDVTRVRQGGGGRDGRTDSSGWRAAGPDAQTDLRGAPGRGEHAPCVQPAAWSFRVLAPGAGYAAAIAVEGRRWELQCWHYPTALWGRSALGPSGG